MQSSREDTLEDWYAIKFCFKHGKNATETYGRLQTAFGASYMNRASVFELHKRYKEGRSLWGMMRGVGGVSKSIHPSWLAKGLRFRLLCWGFKGVQEERFRRKRTVLFTSGQCHSHQDNAPVHYSILVTENLTQMVIKMFLSPHNLDLAPCDFWLFPKLTGCRYETIEEMEEAVTKVIDTLTQYDFHWAFQKLLER